MSITNSASDPKRKGERQRFLVVGLGRFGSSLAQELTDAGHDVLAVDVNMDRVDAIKERVAFAAQLDATDLAALRSVEAGSATAAIVAMGNAFEPAVLSVVAIKELGIKNIWARARSQSRGKILAAIGATTVIDLEAEMAKQVRKTLAE